MEGSNTIVEPSGFTFVEEDDVAFTLQLCREVHRLYGDYHEGDLAVDDYVLAGLTVTMEMLATLSHRVTDGMPGMRVAVAAAQTREMLAVMFGRDPLEGPLEGRFRAHYRSIVDSGRARTIAATPPPLPAGWADAALGVSPLELEAAPAPGRGAVPGPAATTATSATTPEETPLDGVPVDAHPAASGPADAQRERERWSAIRRIFNRLAK